MAFKSTIAMLFILLLTSTCVHAAPQDQDPLILATNDFPPYSYIEDGRLTGIAVEIVKALMERVGNSGKITMLPWNRALKYAQNHRMMLFPFTRRPYREKNFKWIGPIMIDSFVFAVRSSETRFFDSIDDFRKIRVGTCRGTPTDHRLHAFGFTNLQVVSSEKQNAMKLLVGRRIDAWYCSHLILRYTIRMNGLEEKEIRIAYKDMDVEMYIGATLSVPDETVARWQKQFDELKASGEYQRLLYQNMHR